MDIFDIIEELINFNKDQQIKSRIELCESNPSIHVCTLVEENNYENWYNFYSEDNNKNLFSKGKDRLDSWTHLFQEEPTFFFSKEIVPTPYTRGVIQTLLNKLNNLRTTDIKTYFFVLAGLIVIFQVFGDANHRTAKYFYNKMTGEDISEEQEMKINDILRSNDYYSIASNPIVKMTKIINQLINIITTVTGGKKRKNMTKRTRKIRKKRSIKKQIEKRKKSRRL